MDIAFRPIDQWPQKMTPPYERKSPFRCGYSDTLHLLDRELPHIKAKNVVIMLALREGEFRKFDGMPRADARPDHPGVILAFDSKFGPLKLPCDACRSWQDNLRAIAFHLEHLRLSGLYGVGRLGEQYTGWRALPPPIITPPPMSVDAAMRFVGKVGGAFDAGNADSYRSAYRDAARKLHPDTNGGNHLAEWTQLQAAKSVLDRHYGL